MFKNKLQIFFVGVLFSILLIAGFLIWTLWADKNSTVLKPESVTSDTSLQETKNTIQFSLRSGQNFLYKSGAEEFAAAEEFIGADVKYEGKNLFPNNLQNTVYFDRDIPDNLKPFSHFKYQQKIENIPVFAGDLVIHIKNKNEVYAVQGNLLKDTAIPKGIISEEKAVNIALEEARKETSANVSLVVSDRQKFLFNKKLLGLAEEEKTYTTLSVGIKSEGEIALFAKRYFVDLASGKTVFRENLVKGAIDRRIMDCKNGVTNCPLGRKEGDPAVGDADIDNTYQFLGDIYNLYFDNFTRDSFDGNGSQIKSFVNLTVQLQCPNAAWVGTPHNQLQVCDGMVANDVIGHELTHGVTDNTANFVYEKQAGALDESMADIFGYAIDSGDWAIGEDTVLGTIRYMDDPTRNSAGGSQPDGLFSSLYYCQSGDAGGVHVNSGIVNKAFYLMVAGGQFNGCNIESLGKETALKLFYRALTTYLNSTSNFKSLYSGLMQSCTDQYGAQSATCLNAQKAMQAVEIDQQPANNQTGAVCLGIERQTPTCSSGPTITPQDTGTPAPSFTPPPDSTLTPTLDYTATPTRAPTPSLPPGNATSLRVNVHVDNTSGALFNGNAKPSYSDPDSLLIYIEGPTSSGRKFGEQLYVLGKDGQSCRSKSNFPYTCGTGYLIWKGTDGASGTSPGRYKATIIQTPQGWEKIPQSETATGNLAVNSLLTLDLAIKIGSAPTLTPNPSIPTPTLTPVSVRIYGDVDFNGLINTVDYLYYIRAVTGGQLPPKVDADVNGDNDVSLLDREVIVGILNKQLNDKPDVRFFY